MKKTILVIAFFGMVGLIAAGCSKPATEVTSETAETAAPAADVAAPVAETVNQ